MNKDAISLHKKLRGKIYVESRIRSLSPKNLQLIYTPGVANVCKEIQKNPHLRFELTSKANNVAIITDGTRILGLGNIGPDAALPVMEGKSVLYRNYGKISAFPICLNTTHKEKIIEIIKAIAPVFGAINLEDIESPKVLDISKQLEKDLSIPIFHDDRHGTAVVALAALVNSLKLVKKDISKIKVVIAGAGSAGYCISKLLNFAGCRNIIIVDSKGSIYRGRKTHMNKYKKEISIFTNPDEKGGLSEMLLCADVFIGVSGIENLLTSHMVKSMAKDPIIFALTNPYPEINPITAKKAGAKIIATGSYKFKNQVNNALIFPYFMRSILDLRIRKITLEILYVTALALAGTLDQSKLSVNKIIPEINDKRIQGRVTKAIKKITKNS